MDPLIQSKSRTTLLKHDSRKVQREFQKLCMGLCYQSTTRCRSCPFCCCGLVQKIAFTLSFLFHPFKRIFLAGNRHRSEVTVAGRGRREKKRKSRLAQLHPNHLDFTTGDLLTRYCTRALATQEALVSSNPRLPTLLICDLLADRLCRFFATTSDVDILS